MRPIIIALINQKGGCGKSSTCFHLAGALAQAGQRVLLVDADPQGSLSQGFFGSHLVECLEPQETLAALFRDDAFLAPEALCVRTPLDQVAIIRANQHLAVHNTPCPDTTGLGSSHCKAAWPRRSTLTSSWWIVLRISTSVLGMPCSPPRACSFPCHRKILGPRVFARYTRPSSGPDS